MLDVSETKLKKQEQKMEVEQILKLVDMESSERCLPRFIIWWGKTACGDCTCYHSQT